MLLLELVLVVDLVDRTDRAVPARLDSAEFGGAPRPSCTRFFDNETSIILILLVVVATAAEF